MKKTCRCGNKIKKTQILRIKLEQCAFLLYGRVPVSLDTSCHDCLKSMLHDTQTELAAIKSRTERPLSERFTLVAENTDEYTKVKTLFAKSLTNTIIRIEKNNNAELHGEFERAVRRAGIPDTKLLFHGSNNMNYMNIMENGFDIKRCSGGSLGVGVYFADNASYSDSFTNALELQGPKCSMQGSSSVIKNMLLCDVVLDGVAGHGSDIHCVRNDRHGYPKYIIYYENSA